MAEGDPAAPRARRFLVSGLVQGVGFRSFTRSMARKLGLAGFVQNLPDGRVEAVAAGGAEALERFAGLLARGPATSAVRELVEEPAPLEGLPPDFVIRR